MIDLKEEMVTGVLWGMHAVVADLLKTTGGSDSDSRERAKLALVKLGETTTMMVELIDEIFGASGEGEQT